MTYPETWPDGTPKSMNNAFNWRTSTATATPKTGTTNARSLDMHSNGNIYTYTKAAKIQNRVTPTPPRTNKMFTIKKQ